MKKVALSVLFALGALATFAQNQFTFSGTITGQSTGYARLQYLNEQDKLIVDSCLLQNGAFVFKGNINGFSRSTLTVYNPPFQPKGNYVKNTATVYLEQGNITVAGIYDHLNELKVSGSKTHDENNELLSELNKIQAEFEPISASIEATRKEYALAKKNNQPAKTLDSLNDRLIAIDKQREPFVEKYENAIHKFANTHPNSFISAVQITTYTGSWPLDTVKKLYNSFSTAVKNSLGGKAILKRIDDRKKALAEKTAKNFTALDINGKTISLSNFKGRYVLLDFWGSWCVPCREGMPHTIGLYKKYNKAGFDVIAVAVQEPSPEEWKRAIQKDKTGIWTNIRGDITNDKINAQYGINVYPTKILIDKTGTIIGRYDGSEPENALDKKLAEIFGGKD